MITGLRPYPAYRDSGVEWLGEMPEHWRALRAKWLFRKVERPSAPDDDVVTCFRDGTVTRRKNRRASGFTESLQELGYQGVRRGDLVIHAMDAFAGACGVSDSDGKSSPVYSVCTPRDGATNAHYFASLVREMARNRWILALARGVRERSTDFRFPAFGDQALPVPPTGEQDAIVRFLNDTDRRIRRTIWAQEKRIELLEEQRQAIIDEAVTGQIDVRTGKPYPAYKDSGVGWLGKVPELWEYRRLKTLLQPVDCRSADGSETLLSLRRDHGVVIYAEHFSRPPQADSLVGFKLVLPDQLVVNRLQANNGLVFRSALTGLVSPDYSVFERTTRVHTQYLSDLLRTVPYRAHFHRQATGLGTGTAGFLRIYDDGFLATPVALPSTEEQAAIVEYVDHAVARAETLADRAERQVKLTRDYRIRLIADVVTGKLDVRDAAAAPPDTPPG